METFVAKYNYKFNEFNLIEEIKQAKNNLVRMYLND